MSEDSTISDDWREEYKKVINAVVAVAENTNDVSTALVLIQPFLASSTNEHFKEDVPSDVVSILTTLYIRLLIQEAEEKEDNDDSVFDVPLRYIQSLSNRETNQFVAEEAYCYYRMKQYNKAKDICETILSSDDASTTSNDHDGLRHVYAQTLYRLGDYSNAHNVYHQLLSSSPSSSTTSAIVDRNEIYTNAVAALGSQQPENDDRGSDNASTTNIVTQMEGLSFEISKMVTLGNKHLRLTDLYSSEDDNEDDTPPIIPYDLSYNVATAVAVHSLEEDELQMATSLLLQSQQACRTSQEAEDESDMKSELAPIQCNQAYALIKKMFLLNDTNNDNDELDKKRRLAEAFFTKVVKASGSSSSSMIAMHNLALLQSLRKTSTTSSDGTTKKSSSSKTKSKSSSPTKAIESALEELQQQQQHSSSVSKINPNQVLHMLQNKALLQLKHGEQDQQCQETIDEMRRYHHQECGTNGGNTSTSNGGKGGKQHRSKKGKQQQQQQPVGRCIEADIVEILLLNQQSKMNERDKVLKEAFEANPTSVSLVLLKTQLVLSQSSTNNDDESDQRGLVEEAAQILQSFVDTTTTVPVGVVTTLISMYHQCHETSKANELLLKLSSGTLQSFYDEDDENDGLRTTSLSTRFVQDIVSKALYLVEMNCFEQAVEILETLLKRFDDDDVDDASRTMVVAALIKALMANSSSSEDGEERATTLISELSSFEDDDEMSSADNMDAEELEDTPLPRLARSKKRFGAGLMTTDGSGVDAMLGGDDATSRLTNQKLSEKKQRLKQHRLNQRAKKRDEYIQSLKSRGDYNELRPPIPDPERWIPKHQRSSYGRGGNRRHRGRNVIGGAQGAGAGTERDALRLDVAARKKAGDTEPLSSASSTAHMTVATSSGNVKRKGGGGGRKKK